MKAAGKQVSCPPNAMCFFIQPYGPFQGWGVMEAYVSGKERPARGFVTMRMKMLTELRSFFSSVI